MFSGLKTSVVNRFYCMIQQKWESVTNDTAEWQRWKG